MTYIKTPQIYCAYHVHSQLSNGTTNIDSITNFRDYVHAAKECGMTALGFSEHGNLFEWLHKKEAIEAAGMKYLHCVEVYLTEDNNENCARYTAIDLVDSAMTNSDVKVKFHRYWQREDGAWIANVEDSPIADSIGKSTLIDIDSIKTEYIKNRDNYHCVLIAKNYDGVKELNKLVSKSFSRDDFHFYYMPRISFEELFTTSDNIIITTACLGGALHNGTPTAKERFLGFIAQNKHRCFLEIQHHNDPEQIEYNQMLYQLSQDIGIPLIAGTDTHALNDEHMDGRAMLQKAKNVRFSNEDSWDLTFKTTAQLIQAYKKQKSLPMHVVYEAINNTIAMSDMVEEFKLDYNPKYPKLYDDSEAAFKKKINEGVIWRGIMKKPNYKEYLERIYYEYDTYKHNNAIDFMLLEEDYKSEMRKRNIKYGYSRGSVSGSVIAYLLGITEVDSVKYNLNFERFMNRERISLADIDSDWLSEDRKVVKDYLYGKNGLHCCDIVTFNTIALKGAIRDICRGMYNDNMEKLSVETKKKIDDHWKKLEGQDSRSACVDYSDQLKREIEENYLKNAIHKDVPYEYLKFADRLIELSEGDEAKARKQYSKIFKYVDLVMGCVVSVGNHPAGCVVSPVPVNEWFGTFTTSTNEYPISVLNMKEIDSLNFVKLDILGLDNIGLIYKTCDLAGIPFLTPDNTPADDMDVWNSIREDTTMIFQWESQSATAYLKQLFSDETVAKVKEKNPNFSYMDLLSIGNGAIRPAGESYRDNLAKGIYQDNGHAALNDFLSSTLGYLVYQEEVIEFLHSFCGYTMGMADIVRRGFAKKSGTDKFIPDIKAGFKKTMKEKYGVPEVESDKLIVNFIKVIEDASSYLFSKNHADPYSWIGYICGYLRYHYPLEFITTALNIFEDKEDKSLAIINYAKNRGIKISPIKFRHSIAQYNFDKETGQIFKGISSIKFMNAAVADEIYALRDRKYSSFMDLLFDLDKYTSINSRQLKILIELDFFEEFGDANYLMKQYELFDSLNGKSQIKKAKLEELGLTEDQVKPHVGNETEKMFTKVNMYTLLTDIAPTLKCQPRTLKSIVQSQIEHLGYVDIMNDRYAGMAAVLEVDTKYAPKLKMHSLKNGTVVDCKIDKRTFNKCKLASGDIIRITGQTKKPKQKRTEDGRYEPIPGVTEVWVTGYYKVNDL